MCGIVAAVSGNDVSRILLDGLKRLEYRGYDSAGLVLVNGSSKLQRKRTVGKVNELINAFNTEPFIGHLGLAHTRWATHGKPSENNAHPHFSGDHNHDEVAIVHNGIIENYLVVQKRLIAEGYQFQTETDSEVIAHLIHSNLKKGNNFLQAVQKAVAELDGAFAICVIYINEPNHLIAARKGAPVVIGISDTANYVASDPLALLQVTQRFIYLEEGDIADLNVKQVRIYDKAGKEVKRDIHFLDIKSSTVDKGPYSHFMLKEILEQPYVVAETLSGCIGKDKIFEEVFGPNAAAIFDKTEQVQIVACGTSYHAGMVARYWFEDIAKIPCRVEVASEIRYRNAVVPKNTLLILISQSGETADTLAALRLAKNQGYLASLAICNVPESSLVRESDLVFMTRAGVEIGVASTKAFTTQLAALLLLGIALGRRHGLNAKTEKNIVEELHELPNYLSNALQLNQQIKELAQSFANKQHALFLGRGLQYPVALEGALKLKEISYIHAEAYPAGELKHGPLALVDQNMPVIAVVPKDDLLEKLISNLHEVRARGGELFVFADSRAHIATEPGLHIIEMPKVPKTISPIVYTVPLQLLAYYVALIKGTDVDQPRNLAKSVTVE